MAISSSSSLLSLVLLKAILILLISNNPLKCKAGNVLYSAAGPMATLWRMGGGSWSWSPIAIWCCMRMGRRSSGTATLLGRRLRVFATCSCKLGNSPYMIGPWSQSGPLLIHLGPNLCWCFRTTGTSFSMGIPFGPPALKSLELDFACHHPTLLPPPASSISFERRRDRCPSSTTYISSVWINRDIYMGD